MPTTEIAILLDRSGSMQPRKADHEGGLRSFVQDQRTLSGDVFLTFARFDSEEPFELVYDRAPLATVEEEKLTLLPRGGTPLLEAASKLLTHLEAKVPLDHAVIVMVITDGQENQSAIEYTRQALKDRIEACQRKGWIVLYLGANVDEFQEAGSLGIGQGQTLGYTPGVMGVANMYYGMTANVTHMRQQVNSGNMAGMGSASAFTDDQRTAAKVEDHEKPRGSFKNMEKKITPVEKSASDTTPAGTTEGA